MLKKELLRWFGRRLRAVAEEYALQLGAGIAAVGVLVLISVVLVGPAVLLTWCLVWKPLLSVLAIVAVPSSFGKHVKTAGD